MFENKKYRYLESETWLRNLKNSLKENSSLFKKFVSNVLLI